MLDSPRTLPTAIIRQEYKKKVAVGRAVDRYTLANTAPNMASISAGEFNDICSKFVQKYQSANITDELRRNGYAGWNWVSHPVGATLDATITL